jgi:hypothetical protein
VETTNLHQLALARSQLYCAGENGSLSYYYGSRMPATPMAPRCEWCDTHKHAKTSPTTDVYDNQSCLTTDATDAVEIRVPEIRSESQSGTFVLKDVFQTRKIKDDIVNRRLVVILSLIYTKLPKSKTVTENAVKHCLGRLNKL